MVGWYDPLQLLSTGVQVAVSALLGTRADYRLTEALAKGSTDPVDYSALPEMWLDYVADLGDGWNSTYAVASLLAKDELTAATSAGLVYATKRGNVIVMGGDEVYPTAGRETYRQRSEEPYRAAFCGSIGLSELYAIPGNHDWYDGLVSFTRLFCQHRFFGGLRTRQERSYFALRLPHGWWLVAVDVQLDSDIDRPQLEYFQGVAAQMSPTDNVILCTPEPDWIYGNIYDPEAEKNLAFLEQEIEKASRGARIRLRLAGDLHHYRRHESVATQDTHNVVAGGGGAFLHPTHTQRVERFAERRPEGGVFELKAEYPDAAVSRRLAWRNLLFPVWNPRFGIATAVIYVLLSWWMPHYFSGVELSLSNLPRVARDGLRALASTPTAIPAIALVVFGFVAFTDTHKRWYRRTAGPLHAMTHLGGALLAAWIADRVAERTGFTSGDIGHLVLASVSVAAIGYVVGPLIMGAYLLISVNFFGRHGNEAFSSLRIEDYKNFVRLHIGPDGDLVLYPIGIDRVPRRWRRTDGVGKPEWLPVDSTVNGRLIEGPVRVRKAELARR